LIDHRFQLRTIELRDFKSIRDQRVDLGPLTVVVGANSAGKSTLLQAILALAQAVRSEGATSEFPLNGSLIRLGTFDETRNYLAESERPQIEIKFELLDSSPLRDLVADALEVDPDGETTTTRGRREPRLISWHAFVEPIDNADDEDSESKRGFAEITRLVLSVARISTAASVDSVEPLFDCDINPIEDPSATEELGRLRILNRRYRPGRVARPVPVDGRIQDLVKGAPPRLDGVILSGGVPFAFLQRTTVFDYLAEVWWSTAEETLFDQQPTLFDEDTTVVDDEDQPDRSDLLPIAAAQAARHIDGLLTGDDKSAGLRGGGWGRWLDSADRYFLRALGRLSEDERSGLARSIRAQGEATFRSALRGELPALDGIDEEVLVEQSGAAVEVLTRSGAVAQRFFNNSVEYLGPLREAPHALYDPGPTQTDLGPTGKFAAAVLHAQADSRIVMPTIPDDRLERQRQMVPLNEALNSWLQWFGLADEATSEDLGRLGIGLSVTPSALGRPVDLTSVGVGVSQVLPVVLLCLLAKPGTLIILEQPELHLHPRLQQDLADFLLACVETGRQLVIETHSEHLVNRLRRRVAADDTDEMRELVKLVFAESAEGITTYRESTINPYGGLDDDWPNGFLDLGARESRALIKESATKRRRDSAR
jgi:predicted ATPase